MLLEKFKTYRVWVFAIMFAMGGALFFCCQPERLLVVDMKRAIQTPSKLLSRSTLSKVAQQKLMARFAKLLPETIAAFSQSHRATVVSATVLVHQNKLDITDEIIEQTLARLKEDA